MAKVPVKSSLITHADYNEPAKTLTLHFADGARYHYADVPSLIYKELLHAHSAGKYFHTAIRGVYQATKLPEHVDDPEDDV